MGSYATLVDEMTEVAPLAVDLAPWLTIDHREIVSRVVRQCDSVTVLAYRDTAAAILAQAAGMLRLCETAGIRYRIGVETQTPAPAIPANTTFGDGGEAVMVAGSSGAVGHPRAAAAVRRVRRAPPRTRGESMTLVTVYSRPADTQLISWNLLPDTASAAASSALI